MSIPTTIDSRVFNLAHAKYTHTRKAGKGPRAAHTAATATAERAMRNLGVTGSATAVQDAVEGVQP